MNAAAFKRDVGIDVLKCVCALFVVIIHAPFHIHLAPYMVALARVAVPIFFVITGYYFPLMEKKRSVRKHLQKIGILAIVSCTFYFLLHVGYLNPHPQRYLHNLIPPHSIINFLCFNACPVEGHLWYFFALVYALPILTILYRTRAMRIFTSLIPLLLLANYLLTYTGHYEYYRNWLFTALPYMGIGIFIRSHYKQIINSIPQTRKLYAIYLILCILLYIEWNWYYQHHAMAYRDDYLCTPLMTVCLFLIAIKPRKGATTSKVKSLITNNIACIGRTYSPYIYIFHIAVKNCFRFWHHWKFIYLIYPIWIFTFTLLLCAISFRIIRIVQIRLNAHRTV